MCISAAKSQTTGPILGGFAGGSGSPSASSTTLSGFFEKPPVTGPAASVEEQVSNEFLTFNESAPKSDQTAASPDVNKDAVTTESLSVPPERAAELVADLQSIEAQYAPATEVGAPPAGEDAIAPVRDVAPPPSLVVSKKKEKLEDEFWKDPKKKTTAKKRAGKRAVATQKKTTKSPNRSQSDSARRSSPPDRTPR